MNTADGRPLTAHRTYEANQIADWFLSFADGDAGEPITHLKLQKLVYYAQAWSLALLGRPLFQEEVQAWAHGPVVPSVWRRFKERRREPLDGVDPVPVLEPAVEQHLEDVLAAYGDRSASALERLTHSEEPWLRARGELPPNSRSAVVIPKSSMREFYGSRIKAAEPTAF